MPLITVQTDSLRVQDVRDAYRLIGECRDLGSDPALWQPRLFEGICQLVGGPASAGGEGRLSGAVFEVLSAFDAGLDSGGRQALGEFLREVGPSGCPLFKALRCLSGPLETHTRRQLVTDRVWHRSLSFHYTRRVHSGDALTSMYRTSSAGTIHIIALSRELRQPEFTKRQQQLMRFLHAELGSLIGRALVSETEPSPEGLSPRMRQTLACLLEGDSEKQVAARLGLRQPTTHQYVTALYRHFGVRSRAQLLVHMLRRLGRAPWDHPL